MRAIGWWFRDRRTGRITIAQLPNVSFSIFLATVVVGWLAGDGSNVRQLVEVIGTAALAWWGLDEIVRGVNPWRRVLGVLGLAAVVLRLRQ